MNKNQFLVRLIVNAFALWVAIQIIPGITYDGPPLLLLIIALIFGIVNAFVRPILIVLTLPLILLTFGLFTLVVNAIMLYLTSTISGAFGVGFSAEGFWTTIFGALIISIVSSIVNNLID